MFITCISGTCSTCCGTKACSCRGWARAASTSRWTSTMLLWPSSGDTTFVFFNSRVLLVRAGVDALIVLPSFCRTPFSIFFARACAYVDICVQHQDVGSLPAHVGGRVVPPGSEPQDPRPPRGHRNREGLRVPNRLWQSPHASRFRSIVIWPMRPFPWELSWLFRCFRIFLAQCTAIFELFCGPRVEERERERNPFETRRHSVRGET